MALIVKSVGAFISRRRQLLRPIGFIIGFALIGTVALILTQAAPWTATLEPENSTQTSNITKQTDANSSAGGYLKFGNGGCPSGQYGTVGNCYALSWTKPAMQNTVVYKVSSTGGTSTTLKRVDDSGNILNQWTTSATPTITATSGSQDTQIIWETATHRRLVLSGGRNWLILGGEVDNNTSSGLSNDDRAAIEFDDVLGTIYVEGMHIHGEQGIDGIRIGGNAGRPDVYIQNTRIVDRKGYNEACGVNNGTHADVVQAFGNISSLNLDHVTGETDYQAQMWAKDGDTSMTKFGPSNFRNVNYLTIIPEQSYALNFVVGEPTESVTFSNVYLKHDPNFVYNDPCGSPQQKGDFCQAIVPSANTTCNTDAATGKKYKTWNANFAIPVTGRVTEGLPPQGDYVPDGFAGLNYVSEFP